MDVSYALAADFVAGLVAGKATNWEGNVSMVPICVARRERRR